ncbi:caspase family protein [Phreatobacter sp.]|uniref:caspase family protein n=1 Tax=Phreatobacter sp. TaxID=1966341 RepID=UPI003F6E7EEA
MPPRFFGDDTPGWPEPVAPPTPRVALVIGNGAYRTSRLDNPARDARLIADTLADLGFDTELVTDASKAVLETAIVRLGERLEKAGKDAIGFFYFAGHGIQHRGANFLVPVDAQIPDTRYLKSGAVPVDYLVEELARAHSLANVVVLDACRDSAMRDTGGGLTQGLASIQNLPDGTLVVFSTAAGQVADDGHGDHSPYARALAHHLREPDRRLEEIFFAVSRAVAETTGNAQRPALFVQGAVPSIVLKPGDSLPDQPPPPPLAVPAEVPVVPVPPADARSVAVAEPQAEVAPEPPPATVPSAWDAVLPPAPPATPPPAPAGGAPAASRPVPFLGSLAAPPAPATRQSKAPVLVLFALLATTAAGAGAFLFWPRPEPVRIDLSAPAAWPVPREGAVLWRKTDGRDCEDGSSLVLDGRYCLRSAGPIGAIWEAGHATVPLAAAMVLRASARTGARCADDSLFEAEQTCLAPVHPDWISEAAVAEAGTRPVIGGPPAGVARLEPRGTPACTAAQVQFPFPGYCLTGQAAFGLVTPTILGHERLGGTAAGQPVALAAYKRLGDCPAANTVLENGRFCLVMRIW